MGINDIGFESGRFRRHHNLLTTQGKPNITGPIQKGKGKGNTVGKGHGKGNGAGGGAEPAFWVRTVRVAMNTAAGSQDLTDPTLAWTPKAVRAIHIGNTADGATSGSTSVRGSIGAYDGTNQWSVAWLNSVFSTLERSADNNNLVRAFAAGSDRTVTATALIPGGIRVTHSGSSNASFITLEMFGGTAFQASCGMVSGAASGTTTTITPGFQAQAIFMGTTGTTANTTQGNCYAHVGWASYDGVNLNQFGYQHSLSMPGGTRSTNGGVTDSIIYVSESGAKATITTPGATTFGLAHTVTGMGGGIGWLAMNFGGAANAWAGIVSSPTTTGNYNYTGSSSTPVFASLTTSRVTATNTNQTAGQGGSWSMSSITAAAQFCNHWRTADADGSGGTIDDYAEAASKAINTSDQRSLNDRDASFVGFISGGMTLNDTVNPGTSFKDGVLFIG